MAISTITENHVRSGQVCSKNCDLTKTIIILTAIAIPIITTVFAYVGAFKFLKLQIINPKFTFALKIIVPATLGFGIVLTEIFISVCIFSANKQQNNLPSDDEFQASDFLDFYESEEEREKEREFFKAVYFKAVYKYRPILIDSRQFSFIQTINKPMMRESITLGSGGIYAYIQTINKPIIRGIVRLRAVDIAYTAVKMDILNSVTKIRIATFTIIIYQPIDLINDSLINHRYIDCKNIFHLVNREDSSRLGLACLMNLFSSSPNYLRSIINKKGLNIVNYGVTNEDFRKITLRLHKKERAVSKENSARDKKERFNFMLTFAQTHNLFLINLSTKDPNNLFLFRFLINFS